MVAIEILLRLGPIDVKLFVGHALHDGSETIAKRYVGGATLLGALRADWFLN